MLVGYAKSNTTWMMTHKLVTAGNLDGIIATGEPFVEVE
jgi:hypothetical protein